jgi:hypothetical protein
MTMTTNATTTNNTTTTTGYRELNAILERAGQDPGSVAAISDDQLRQLQGRWTRMLLSRLDQASECAGPEPEIDTVGAAWRQLASEQLSLRAVLDAAEPRSAALGAAMRAEFRYLALAVGSVSVHDPDEEAVRQGQAYRDLFRSGVDGRRPKVERRPRRSSWRVFSRAA